MKKWKDMVASWKRNFGVRLRRRLWMRLRAGATPMLCGGDHGKKKQKEAEVVQGPARMPYRMLPIITQGFRREIQRDLEWVLYEGILPDGESVMVKHFSSENMGARRALLVREMNIHMSMRHRHILSVRAVCSDTALLFPFMSNATLDLWLCSPAEARRILSWRRRTSIALQLAQALQYMHEQADAAPVAHLHLSPRCVFLDAKFNAHLGNLGGCLYHRHRHRYMDLNLAPRYRYMAPDGLASVMADVYSFGILLLDLVRGRSRSQSQTQAQDEGLEMAVDEVCRKEVMRSRVAREQAKRLLQIGLWCAAADALRRPRMGAVVLMLQGGPLSS